MPRLLESLASATLAARSWRKANSKSGVISESKSSLHFGLRHRARRCLEHCATFGDYLLGDSSVSSRLCCLFSLLITHITFLRTPVFALLVEYLSTLHHEQFAFKMPSALPETSLVNDHGGSPNDTEIPIANGDPPKPSKGDEPEGKDKDEKKSIPRIRASKLEYKTVNQMYGQLPYQRTDIRLIPALFRWDRKSFGHKLVEQLDKTDDEDVYEEYIFVERRKYGRLL